MLWLTLVPKRRLGTRVTLLLIQPSLRRLKALDGELAALEPVQRHVSRVFRSWEACPVTLIPGDKFLKADRGDEVHILRPVFHKILGCREVFLAGWIELDHGVNHFTDLLIIEAELAVPAQRPEILTVRRIEIRVQAPNLRPGIAR